MSLKPTFPLKRPGDSLDAAHVNLIGSTIGTVADMGTPHVGQSRGHLRMLHTMPGHVHTLAAVERVELDDNGDFDKAYCSLRGAVRAEWVTETREYELDPRGWQEIWNADQYRVVVPGDVIPIRYDEGRGRFVPVWLPGFRQAVAQAAIGLGASGVVRVYGAAPMGGGATPYVDVTIVNSGPMAHEIEQNDNIYIVWIDGLARWQPLGGSSGTVLQRVVTDVRVNGYNLEYKYRDIYISPATDESDWTVWHTGSTCD